MNNKVPIVISKNTLNDLQAHQGEIVFHWEEFTMRSAQGIDDPVDNLYARIYSAAQGGKQLSDGELEDKIFRVAKLLAMK